MASSHSPTRPLTAGFSLFYAQIKHFRKRLLWLGVAAILSVTSSTASASVGVSLCGTIADITGEPVEGAMILASPGEATATSDWTGSFEFAGLSNGRYTLTVSHLGFISRQYESVRILKGEITRIRIELTPEPIVLPDSRVHTFRSSSPLISQSDVILTRKDWELKNARTLPEALNQVTGISVLDGGRITRLSIRGSPSRMVSVDRDGIPLQDAATGETDLTTVRLDDLDAIGVEINGAGGKIHLLSRDIQLQDGSSRAYGGGLEVFSTEGIKIDGNVGFRSKYVGLQTGFGGTYDRGMHSYRLADGSTHNRINNDYRSASGYLRISRRVGRIKIEGALYHDLMTRGIPNLIYETPRPDASLQGSRITARLGILSQIFEDDFETFIFTQHYDGEYLNPEFQTNPVTGQIIHFLPEHTIQQSSRSGLSLNYQSRINEIDPRFGVRIDLDRYVGRNADESNTGIGIGFGSVERKSYEVDLSAKPRIHYNIWTVTISPFLKFNAVEDEGGKSYNNLLPAVSGAVERSFPWGVLGISVRWSRSVVIPAFHALLTAESHYAVGNPNLRPEKGESLELNLRTRSDFNSWRGELEVTPFRRNIDDLIVWQRNAFSKYYPDNVASSFARGVEGTLSIGRSDDKFNATVTYINNVSTNETPGDINRGKITPNCPRHSGSAALYYRFNNWGGHFNGRWVGLRYSTMSNYDPISTAGMGLPAYSIYDVSIDYRPQLAFGELILTVGIDNIFDAEYRIVERSPMPGRIYFLRASAEIN